MVEVFWPFWAVVNDAEHAVEPVAEFRPLRHAVKVSLPAALQYDWAGQLRQWVDKVLPAAR